MKKVGMSKRVFRSRSENNNEPDERHLSSSSYNGDNLLISKGLSRPSRVLCHSNSYTPTSRASSAERPTSILGNTPLSQTAAKNDAGSLFKPKGLSNFFQRGTLTRNKKVSIWGLN